MTTAPEKETQFSRYAARARRLSDAQLHEWLAFHAERGNLVVAGAIRFVMAERRLAARQDADLRAVFA